MFYSPYSTYPNPLGNIKNFWDVNINYFMNIIKYQAVISYDRAFEVKALTQRFEHTCNCVSFDDNSFSRGKAKAERIIRRESKPYWQHLESIKAALPTGVTMQIKENISEGHRRHLYLTLDVYISATAEYSKKCFDAISTGNIVHDCDMPVAFINEAKAFKERVLSSKIERIQTIKDICDKYGYLLSFSESAIHTSRYFGIEIFWENTSFHSLGMMDLEGAEQCYGLAWAIAELSEPTKRCFLKVLDVGAKTHVLLERCAKPVVAPPPKYDEW